MPFQILARENEKGCEAFVSCPKLLSNFEPTRQPAPYFAFLYSLILIPRMKLLLRHLRQGSQTWADEGGRFLLT